MGRCAAGASISSLAASFSIAIAIHYRGRAQNTVNVVGELPVVSRNSIHLPSLGGTVIEVEKPAQPLSASHGSSRARSRNTNDQFVRQSLMVPFVMVVRDILTYRVS